MENSKDKVIITIARQYGSGGRTVGKMLAEELGIPFYDREIIELAAEESGVNPRLFEDEKKNHSLRSLLAGGYQGGKILSPESSDFTSDDNLFNYQKKIILELAKEGSCVLIGRCADDVLKDEPDAVRIFVHAPADFCLQEAMKVNSLPEAEVEKKIARIDEYRARYYKYYTGREWKDARNYDLSLDSSKLGFTGTAQAILAYIKVRQSCKVQK